MADRKIKNLTSDYLTCTICWNIFTDPKMLQCGHSFCAKCLEGYIRIVRKQRDWFECPVCRDANDISANIDVNDMINSLSNDTVTISILQAIGLTSVDIDSSDNECLKETTPGTIPEELKRDESFCACARHRDKNIDTYCPKHEVVICSECAKENHKRPVCECSSARIVINKRLNALKSLVAQQVSDASMLFDSPSDKAKTVKSLFDEAQKCINDIEQSFDDIYRAFKQRIQSLRVKAKESLDRDQTISEIRTLQENIVARVKAFDEDTADLNPNQTLKVISNLCVDSSELQKNITELSQKVKSGSLMMYVESDLNVLDVFVSGLKNSLPGEFLTMEEIDQEPNDKEYVMVTETGNFEDFDCLENDKVNLCQQITFSAKSACEDKCMLSGVAMLGTTAVVLVDQTNKRLKKYKIPEGKFLNELELEYEPHQVATLRESSDVAVSLWDVPKIVIASTDPVLEIVRTIDTDTEYIGLTSHMAERLAVSSILSRRVDILDTQVNTGDGSRQRETLYQSSRRRSFPDRLAATSDGKVVIRNRRRNEISCFGRNKMLLWSRRLKHQLADVTCFRGRVFTTLRSRNEIVSFREDGQGEVETLKSRDPIHHPWALDGFKDCLVVTEDAPSDLVHVFIFE
ncbi:uncharacterized protein LOC128220029 [Mya arenaria]|uniref:uncharacterized protein LOC128220029 n=1 Tax=Mya arenaria TaxID=6604 RepID=UPI0022E47BD5|nr:uncharacterized protein LOC128220029 [Mya arenaria]